MGIVLCTNEDQRTAPISQEHNTAGRTTAQQRAKVSTQAAQRRNSEKTVIFDSITTIRPQHYKDIFCDMQR